MNAEWKIDPIGAAALVVGLLLIVCAGMTALRSSDPADGGFVVGPCGTIFGDEDNSCYDELKGRAQRAGLLLVAAVAFAAPAVVTLASGLRDDKMPFWISLPLVGLPSGLMAFLAFGLFYLIRFASR